MISWLMVGWSSLVLLLGELLDLPEAARALSPLWHIPLVPDAEVEASTLIILSLIAAVLGVMAVVGFARRDLTEG
ncbi:hypothetical protein [Corynebacterium alimapuense]|uniref:Uncharacterized protein n=1 Tax=Corynebacterium alimapuense TaxID=1576874 RepID=A0A3M8K9D2_9CORY|nr:hypothetical protein [Corynebacterium alimapuense]RNE49395.1 hypothetical protein C5L39_03245 [Corynebacterium alimapuense]